MKNFSIHPLTLITTYAKVYNHVQICKEESGTMDEKTANHQVNLQLRQKRVLDGNEAAASVAYRTNEVISIYPITPSSPMGEWADEWASSKKKNIWGIVPTVIQMQSEGGAAGTLHGSLQAGALSTTFTASQGLLLMIPNMYKIAGELTSTVIHVAARTVSTHALSIFGDHSDVMAVRSTGFAILSSGSVQEVMDFALIAQMATMESRVPFLHFFDGFRTSHEDMDIEMLSDEDIRALIDDELLTAHRNRALTPDSPVIRGTAQNPDVFFQSREANNAFYMKCPDVVQAAMDRFAKQTKRHYHLFDYFGAPDAERVIVIMGSGGEVAQETVEHLMQLGEKVGLIKVRLYRPFVAKAFLEALPQSTKKVATLDRMKDPAASGEPLYLDVVEALRGVREVQIVGGRYGLSSKDFTPAMVKAVFDELKKESPLNSFTVGIEDDVTHRSLPYDPNFSTENPKSIRCLFYGLGSDGTVGANKNSIKIIGENTPFHAQGYFVYDSKKSGAMTVSHLRFGPEPIHSSYLISKANFIACHHFPFLEKLNLLQFAEESGTFLLNTPYPIEETWDHLPRPVQEEIIKKRLNFYAINAGEIARKTEMGSRINTIMQTCFFALSQVLPREKAIEAIKESIQKTYGRRGADIVQRNLAAVDATLANLHKIDVPEKATSQLPLRPPVPEAAPEFVKKVLAPMMINEGDKLPVSLLPIDGTFPTGTAQWEKRNIAMEIPVWDPETCIQCGKCSLACPHAVIRAKVYDAEYLKTAPETFKSTNAKWKDWPDKRFTIQVSPEDCTGCGVCVMACPARNRVDKEKKAINMAPQIPLRESESKNFDFFLQLPDFDRTRLNTAMVKDVQLLRPLFEFSGACAGCGETPYLKLLSSLFGDRILIANATGCSSIYCGNLPTTPWTKNNEGRGPAWSNSLFEDNAEFGLGFLLAYEKQAEIARNLLAGLAPQIGETLVNEILQAKQITEADIAQQRIRIQTLKQKLELIDLPEARNLLAVADLLAKKSIWIVGGDGWAYDIGYGGLDHVLSTGKNVNVLVMDTEVYSNTGGQKSKATPLGAVAKFAAGGNTRPKKDLALMAMPYGDIYIARIAMGANDSQAIRAFLEAEAYEGPSLIIAYCPCISHGYDLKYGHAQQKAAVDSGHWILMRFNPELAREGKNPLQIDSKEPTLPLKDYLYKETRYRMLLENDPDTAAALLSEAQKEVEKRYKLYQHLVSLPWE